MSISYRQIVYLDWDDSCLCTTALSKNSYTIFDPAPDPNSEFGIKLKKQEEALKCFLECEMKRSKIVIVTNAEEGWVQHSARHYYPNILDLLQRIDIISARSTYEAKYPKDPVLWKYLAFSIDFGRNKTKHKIETVVSVGDGFYELKAIFNFRDDNDDVIVHSIKLIEQPTVDILTTELSFISNTLPFLYDSRIRGIDLQLKLCNHNCGQTALM